MVEGRALAGGDGRRSSLEPNESQRGRDRVDRFRGDRSFFVAILLSSPGTDHFLGCPAAAISWVTDCTWTILDLAVLISERATVASVESNHNILYYLELQRAAQVGESVMAGAIDLT